jgi:hypothetical protein
MSFLRLHHWLSLIVAIVLIVATPSLSGNQETAPTISIDTDDNGLFLEWESNVGTAYWLESAKDMKVWQEEVGVRIGTDTILRWYLNDDPPAHFFRLTSQISLLGESFDSDPQPRGWQAVSQSQEIFPNTDWPTTGVAVPDESLWQSPPLALSGGEYFRVDFQYRGNGKAWLSTRAFNLNLDWGRYPSVDADGGQLLENDTESWNAQADWKEGIFISRTSKHALTTALELWGEGAEFDNVVVTKLSKKDALMWADIFYAQLPALNYSPPPNRHTHLSRTFSLLQNGGPVRILFVGDSLMQDSANSMLDLLLERRFPGIDVEIQAATGQGTGINKWNDDTNFDWPDQDLDLDQAIIEQRPDLILLGGISNNFTDWNTSYRELIQKIRSRSVTLWGSSPDIILMTGPPFYSPEGNYNTDLEIIADEEDVAFLDLYSAVKNQLSGNLQLSDLMRDAHHANTYGKQFFGRILLSWFEPEPVAAFQYTSAETIVVEERFINEQLSWEHAGTIIVNGELRAAQGTQWSQAVLPLANEIPMSDRICNFYWEMRTDPAAGQDASALHPKLHVPREAERFEQISLNSIIRASWFYMFYVDPGYLVDHPHERHPRAINGFFSDAATSEKFRIRTQPIDEDTLLAEFHYYDQATGQWSDFIDVFLPERSVDIIIDIADDLEGYSTIRSLNFMFPHPVASVQATALTWEPIDN